MTNPVIVAGCGRSGSHWLGNLMMKVFGADGAAFEDYGFDKYEHVVVDSRLRHQIQDIAADGHRIVHLARDGRDVVRSLYAWYNGGKKFKDCCDEWTAAVEIMRDFPLIRLEDLLRKRDQTATHRLPHWSEWDEDTMQTFDERCGAAMRQLRYR